MSAQEKYQSLLELANQNGTTYELTEGDSGTLIVTSTAPSAEAKQALWDEYNRIDPDFKSGDLILNISTGGEAAGGGMHTYTVESGDNSREEIWYQIPSGTATRYLKIGQDHRDRSEGPSVVSGRQTGRRLF
jgi:hypothetical protein